MIATRQDVRQIAALASELGRMGPARTWHATAANNVADVAWLLSRPGADVRPLLIDLLALVEPLTTDSRAGIGARAETICARIVAVI